MIQITSIKDGWARSEGYAGLDLSAAPDVAQQIVVEEGDGNAATYQLPMVRIVARRR